MSGFAPKIVHEMKPANTLGVKACGLRSIVNGATSMHKNHKK